MNKKVLMMIVLIAISLSLVSCKKEETAMDEQMITILDEAGYVLETLDRKARKDYESDILKDRFDIDAKVKELYVGYIDGYKRQINIIVLENEDQAQLYFDALVLLNINTGKSIIIRGSVVITTFYEETANLFIENKE